MNSQPDKLSKAVFISSISIGALVIPYIIVLSIYNLVTTSRARIDYLGGDGVGILITMLISSIIAFIGVLIFMLPTYYICKKFNFTSYKIYVTVGAIGGSLVGLPASIYYLIFSPALFYMFCGIVVSYTFWRIAVK